MHTSGPSLMGQEATGQSCCKNSKNLTLTKLENILPKPWLALQTSGIFRGICLRALTEKYRYKKSSPDKCLVKKVMHRQTKLRVKSVACLCEILFSNIQANGITRGSLWEAFPIYFIKDPEVSLPALKSNLESAELYIPGLFYGTF